MGNEIGYDPSDTSLLQKGLLFSGIRFQRLPPGACCRDVSSEALAEGPSRLRSRSTEGFVGQGSHGSAAPNARVRNSRQDGPRWLAYLVRPLEKQTASTWRRSVDPQKRNSAERWCRHRRLRREASGASARSTATLGAGICENITSRIQKVELLDMWKLLKGVVEITPKNRGK